ncbi:hypothetical protein L6164_035102 [Bauhinia variegata]|uniref:Uncharacterized protein n=1 Tax=Bauhinia variegata TaxID=167791 RepID=A0ACB9KWK8_BAUVA|nr:hypothetical protein L6164_035102 [Bauhinia variegata]
MNKPLLEIEPKELKFIFELKKQSSCTVQLTNNTYQYVAFKVKTTSPKKYSVRPNVGVLMPKSSCEFIVTMQAQKVAPADLVCKDKFLILSTTVPVGTTDEDVTSSMFVKDGSRYVEENKLKVVLTSPPHSPELSPINGTFKKGIAYEKQQIFSRDEIFSSEEMVVKGAEHKMADEELKHEEEMELKPEDVAFQVVKDAGQRMVNEELLHEKEMELKPEQAVAIQVVEDGGEHKMVNEELKHAREMNLKPQEDLVLNTAKDFEELKPEKDVELNTVKDVEELKPEKKAELEVSERVEELKLIEVIEEMNLKLNELGSKLNEAEMTVLKLTEERRVSNQEIRMLQEKLADLSKIGVRKVQVGFPLLYVCMVALISVFLGYRLHC